MYNSNQSEEEVKVMSKQLYRSRTNRKIAGVCGGLGDHFDMDPIFIRAGFVVSLFFGGLGFVLYIVLWLLMPEQPI
jgi:phage shock protein C